VHPGRRGRAARHRPAEHQLDEVVVSQVRGRAGGDPAAVAQDGHRVGQVEDLVEVVGDEQHRRAGRRDPPHGVEQPRGLGRGQGRGGLVEDEQRRRSAGPVQRPGDRHRGPLGLGQPADRCRGRDRVAQGGERGPRGGPLRAARGGGQPSPTLGEVDVVGDGEGVDEAEVLVHEAHPGGAGGVGGPEPERDPGDGGVRARFRAVVAGEDLGQCRLARTVVPDHGVDLARGDDEIDLVERPLAAEVLAEPVDAERVRIGGTVADQGGTRWDHAASLGPDGGVSAVTMWHGASRCQ
jgi:hypothetical protein